MKNYREQLEKLLPLVEKPARYIGGEIGQVRKQYSEGMLRFALAYPEIYEIGASHHGGTILYQAVNAREELICERVYCPWTDMAELLRKKNVPLLSIESSTPIADFDVVGFSLEYELSYTNIFEMLDLAGIPLKSSDRGEEHPLIIAGGPSVFNPEPIADFIDFFIVGDAEIALPKILEFINHSGLSRNDLLKALAQRDGVYVPKFYQPNFKDGIQDGFDLSGDVTCPVKSLQLKELPEKNYLFEPIIPWVEAIHDRLSLEIMRGCGQGCRFCSAGWIYRPVRERDFSSIISEAQKYSREGGWEEVGFLSLSSTDYSALDNLLSRSGELAEKNVISIALPSLRPEGLSDSAIAVMAKTRKTSMTFAPEAGSERLRAVINKSYNEDALLDTIDRVYTANWRTVKLYFMVGLPTETDEDIEAIADLCRRAWKIAKRRRGRLNVSISPFVPKGHTPFAWEKQATPEEIQHKYDILRDGISRKIKLFARDPRLSRIEVALSRGDRRLGDILLEIWHNGGGFDAWGEHFEPDEWEKSFASHDLPLGTFAQELDPERIMPWEIIDKGIPKKLLLSERKKAYNVETSSNCFEKGGCEECGICDFEKMSLSDSKTDRPVKGNYGRRRKKVRKTSTIGNTTLRIRLSRELPLRWLGHLDITRTISRSIRRSGLSVAYSDGHHRHQKVSFGPPLPVGYMSRAEYMDIDFEKPVNASDMEKFSEALPNGIELLDYKPLLKGASSIFSSVDSALFSVEIHRTISLNFHEDFQELISRKSIPFDRYKKTVDLTKYLKRYHIEDHGDFWKLHILLQCDPNGAGRPGEYIQAMGIDPAQALALPYVREELLIRRGRKYFNPFGNSWGTWEDNIEKRDQND